ncbi:MAG: hypothetical protein U0821_08440 [Chloroflexota bacterium]
MSDDQCLADAPGAILYGPRGKQLTYVKQSGAGNYKAYHYEGYCAFGASVQGWCGPLSSAPGAESDYSWAVATDGGEALQMWTLSDSVQLVPPPPRRPPEQTCCQPEEIFVCGECTSATCAGERPNCCTTDGTFGWFFPGVGCHRCG